MNFLVDAQLPRRMTGWLTAVGCDAKHTLDLPDANRTTDEQVSDIADLEQRVVVTKDADFVDSHPPRTTREATLDLDREHQQPGSSRSPRATDSRHSSRVRGALVS